jgi:hypothetical protein
MKETPGGDDISRAVAFQLKKERYEADPDAELVQTTGQDNPPAVGVWTGKTVRYGSRTVQNVDPLLLGGSNRHPYWATHRFCRLWLNPSVPIASSGYQVVLFIVAFRYHTANSKMLTFVGCCPFLTYWLP